MQDLLGKVAVVTGAASGIGRATALRLATAGMRIAMADIDAESLREAAEQLTADGHDVLAVPTDVSSRTAIESLRDAALDAFGAVHVVHNNAGVVASGAAEDISLDLWDWVLDVDLWSVIPRRAGLHSPLEGSGRRPHRQSPHRAEPHDSAKAV